MFVFVFVFILMTWSLKSGAFSTLYEKHCQLDSLWLINQLLNIFEKNPKNICLLDSDKNVVAVGDESAYSNVFVQIAKYIWTNS